MARCEVCCWGEVDADSVDGSEMCSACVAAMDAAQRGEEVEA